MTRALERIEYTEEQRVRFQQKTRWERECLVWTGARQNEGYGLVRINKVLYSAHRTAWQMGVSPIPEGMIVCHSCDNPPCVFLAHLFLGTDADNAHDRERKQRGGIRLTVPLIQLIRQRHDEGWSNQQIADQYGIGKTRVQTLVAGKTYRHLEVAR